METNPYAPPKAPVADVDPSATGLKRRGIVVMILLMLGTFGLYYPIWFFRRRKAFNRLDSPRKLSPWPLRVYAAYFVVEFVIGFITVEQTLLEALGFVGTGFLAVIRLTVAIMMWVQCFIIKDILEDHLSGGDDDGRPALFAERVTLSGVLTFFLTIFYLQHIINRDVVGAHATR